MDIGDILSGNFGDIKQGDIENHPLNVFTRLHAESPSNKVYKECLENEIDNAVKVLTEEIDDSILVFLKSIVEQCSLTDEDLKWIDEQEIKDEIKIQQYVVNKIILRVYNAKFNKN